MDSTTAGGRLVFHVLGALAQFERELVRERAVAGLSAARRRGRVGGRKRLLTSEQARQASLLLESADCDVGEICLTLGYTDRLSIGPPRDTGRIGRDVGTGVEGIREHAARFIISMDNVFPV